MKKIKKQLRNFVFVFFTIIVILTVIKTSYSLPTGAQIISNTSSRYTVIPYNRSDAGGTISTINIYSYQQVEAWKGYVGNVTGKFALADSAGYEIYDWQFTITTGEVYITRNSSPEWLNITCANRTTISNEETTLNMISTEYDTINKTFNETIHKSFRVGSINITNSTCQAIMTFVNGTRQPINENSFFQQVLIQSFDTLIYTSILEVDQRGYRNGSTYDFQAIVPDDDVGSSITQYFFYVELGN
ncbi:MAG: hypothetical protein QXG00_05315 [Candidatus Woesearchaeota archaeon]